MAYEQEKQTALEAVKKAAKLCASVQHNLIAADTLEKKDRSPVTIADYGSQAVISTMLARELPKDALVGEEDSLELEKNTDMREKVYTLVKEQLESIDEATMIKMIDRGNQETDYQSRYWTCDPIDGTKGFLRKEQYAVALALIEDGEVKLGVLGCPNLPLDFHNPTAGNGCILYAIRGKGAFMCDLEGEDIVKITVDKLQDPSRARFAESVESAHSAHSVHAQISEALGITTEPLRIDSQGKYAAVARGDVSIYLRYPKDDVYREKIWDHAAGLIIVEEAGGTVTDIYGKALNFSLGRKLLENRGVVATNGTVHDKIIEVIGKVA
ncbi:3'(2'),5'-bisphosphate nucleotidase [candidate division KSB1 bacterium]|nr:3'(2'),5'-bisphosphate nucleotidase [candidate division KSB1 bacterium]RQW00020.1 MAG: 3'(2'),5'-bisphosphate nucleotidase [candidate division KSB1 bacterium]